MRTELVWDGKYDEYGKRREVDVAACAMPMQKIETVDEPHQRAAAEGQMDMFEQKLLVAQEKTEPYQADFRNRLFWGDNKLIMASLLKEFKGKINCGDTGEVEYGLTCGSGAFSRSCAYMRRLCILSECER